MSRSLVWQYFDVGNDIATCKDCKKKIKRDTEINTSNPRWHLPSHHQEKHAALLQLEKARQSEQDREEAISESVVKVKGFAAVAVGPKLDNFQKFHCMVYYYELLSYNCKACCR